MHCWLRRDGDGPIDRRRDQSYQRFHVLCPTGHVALSPRVPLPDAAAAIVARLVEGCGERLSLGGRTYYAFPRPEHVAQLDTGELQSLGLSRARAVALRELAAKVLSGELAAERLEALPGEAAMEALM